MLPDAVKRYALAQRTEVGNLKDYENRIRAEVERIKPFLVPGDVMDIGCGIGFMSALVAKHCGGKLYLVDGTGWSEKQGGWWDSKEAWNDTSLTAEVVESLGITDYEILPIGTKDLPEVDNVISTLSWGWHYPVDTYLDSISLRPGGRLIIDLRDNRPDERIRVQSRFRFKAEIQRHWRPGSRICWEQPKKEEPTDRLQIVLWKWGSLFSSDYVNRMKNMLSRHLHMPHDVVCITDNPSGIDPGIRIVPLWHELKSEGKCTVRLKAFHPSMREIIGPRFAWIDLDCVIVDDVTPIFSRTEDFIISGVELPPQPYNGSIVMMDAGCRPQVYETFDRKTLEREKQRLNYGGSDQAWIAICLGPNEATWTEEDGIYTYRDYIDPHPKMPNRPMRPAMKGPRTNGKLPEGSRIIVFNGAHYDTRNARCLRMSPWIKEHWR